MIEEDRTQRQVKEIIENAQRGAIIEGFCTISKDAINVISGEHDIWGAVKMLQFGIWHEVHGKVRDEVGSALVKELIDDAVSTFNNMLGVFIHDHERLDEVTDAYRKELVRRVGEQRLGYRKN